MAFWGKDQMKLKGAFALKGRMNQTRYIMVALLGFRNNYE